MVQEYTKIPKREISDNLAGNGAEVVDSFAHFVLFISTVILSLFLDRLKGQNKNLTKK